MPRIELETFQPEEWQVYKTIRLAALKDSPDAFGSTYEKTSKLLDSEWKQRLKSLSTLTDLPMLARLDGDPAGLGWAKIEPHQLDTAHLYQMWVKPNYRGYGIGKLLVQRAINWARQNRAIKLELEVTCGNHPAETLYTSMGFKTFGTEQLIRPDSSLVEKSMRLNANSGLSG